MLKMIIICVGICVEVLGRIWCYLDRKQIGFWLSMKRDLLLLNCGNVLGHKNW